MIIWSWWIFQEIQIYESLLNFIFDEFPNDILKELLIFEFKEDIEFVATFLIVDFYFLLKWVSVPLQKMRGPMVEFDFFGFSVGEDVREADGSPLGVSADEFLFFGL